MSEAHFAASRRAARPWTLSSLLGVLLMMVLGLTPATAASEARTSSFAIRDQAGWADGIDGTSDTRRLRRAPRVEAVRTARDGRRAADTRRTQNARRESNARRTQNARRTATARRAQAARAPRLTGAARVGPARVTLGLGSLFTTQFDGSPYANGNCNMAAGAMLFEVQTGRMTSGAMLRRWSGARTRGTNLGDLARAFRREGQSIDTRENMAWASFSREVRSGRSAVVQGWYGHLPRKHVLQGGFTTAHSVFVLGYSRHALRGEGGFYVMDPLGSGSYDGHWWSRQTLRRFGWSGSPNIAGTGARAFYGNVALQATPSYKNLRGRASRPAFQSYWDTSKALLQRARTVRVVKGSNRGKPTRVVRVRDPHLKMTINGAAKANLSWPIASWSAKRNPRLVGNSIKVRVGPWARVVATAKGRVVYRSWNAQGGMTLWIQHGPKLYTVYQGLDRVRVSPGQWVDAGRVLGKVGMKTIRTGSKAGKRTGQLTLSVHVGTSYKAAKRVSPIRFVRGGRGAVD